MKLNSKKISLLIVLLTSFFSFGQKKPNVLKTSPVNLEIQNIVKLIFDAPELIKLYKDTKNLTTPL